MATIGSLVLSFLADTGPLDQSLRRASRSVNSSTARMNRALGSVDRAFGALGLTIGSVAGAGGLGLVVKNSLKAAREIEQLSTRAGVTAETLQELSFAAGRYGVAQDAVVDGLKELNLRADEFAQTGAGPAAEAFKRLGLSQAEVNKNLGDADKLFGLVISRLQGLGTAAQIRISDEIFGGTGGEQFVQFLGLGADGIDRLRAAAHDAGIVIDDTFVKKGAEVDRQLEDISTRFSAQLNVAILENIDSIEKFVDRFARMSAEIANGIPHVVSLIESLGDLLDTMDRTNPAKFGSELAQALGLGKSRVEELNEEIRETASALALAQAQADATGFPSRRVAQYTQRLRELRSELEQIRPRSQTTIEASDAGFPVTPSSPRQAATVPAVRLPGRKSAVAVAEAAARRQGALSEAVKRTAQERARERRELERQAETMLRMVETEAERAQRLAEQAEELRRQGVITDEQLEKIKRGIGETRETALDLEGVLSRAGNGLRDALADGKLEARELGDILLDAAIGFITQMAQAQFGAGGGNGGFGGFGDVISGSGLGDIFGGSFGDIFSGGGGDLFAGFFADGGLIPHGQFGVVGEAGPELVTGPARVTPLAEMGGPEVIDLKVYVDARNSVATEEIVERAAERGAQRGVARVQRNAQRGGSIASMPRV